jgi:uncharacterized membrane protein
MMQNSRPRINVPYQQIDIVIELISITILLLMFVYTGIEYANLPDTIPTHFNAQGIADDFGSKMTIWLVPIIAIVLYLGLFAINKFPHLHNYMVNITDENALKNYRFSTRILRIINLLCAILMAYVTYYIIHSANGHSMSLGSYFLPIVIGISILLPIILFVYMKKLNQD